VDYTPACDPPDKYDRAIQYLLEQEKKGGLAFTRAVQSAWGVPDLRDGGALFGYCSRSGSDRDAGNCGCLTQIRLSHREKSNYPYLAATPELTAEIVADERIPERASAIEPHHLPVFAEWQRRLDEELCRT
jgi:hypothetical protein